MDAARTRPALTIRPERPQDREAISQVHQLAFGQPNEALLVEALRRAPAFIPELSLVALDATQVVGHILFSRIAVRTPSDARPALALAPMAVLPAFQRRGIGSGLVKRGLADARSLGHGLVIVVGHPDYYPRFGFVRAEPFGIRAPFEVSGEAFMVLELQASALQGCRGEVVYPPQFAQADGSRG